MALGFRDCCNQYNYFYLVGIPANIEVGETFYIVTSNQLHFCGTYINVPSVRYKVPTYSVSQMTEYSDCTNCIGVNPCPSSNELSYSDYTETSVNTSYNLGLKTIIPMSVSSSPSINPSLGSSLGQVRLSIQGGTPPYYIYSSGTESILLTSQPTSNLLVYDNVLVGKYNLTVRDSISDYTQNIVCEILSPPSNFGVTFTSTPASFYGASDGNFTVIATGGTSPYKYVFSSTTNIINGTFTVTGLTQGNYNVTVTDSGIGEYLQTSAITCTVTQPNILNYPNDMCMEINFCDQLIQLGFEKSQTNYNLRPVYNCINPYRISASSITMRWDTFENFTGWVVPEFSHSGFPVSYNCVLRDFSLFRQTVSTELPQGSWVCNYGTFVNSNIVLNSGSCVSYINLSVQKTDACLANNTYGTITFQRQGGNPPYYYHWGNNISAVPTISNVNPGYYATYVVDSQGTTSNVVPVEILGQQLLDILPNNNITFNHTLSYNIIPQTQLNVDMTEIKFTLAQLDAGVNVNATLRVTIDILYPHNTTGLNDTYAIFNQSYMEDNTLFTIGTARYGLPEPSILNMSGNSCDCGNSTLSTNKQQFIYDIPVVFSKDNNVLNGNLYTQFNYNYNFIGNCFDLNNIQSQLKYRVEIMDIQFNSGCYSLGNTENNNIENYWLIKNNNNNGMLLIDYLTTNPNLNNLQLC
jgi:hypothetical protein